MTFMTLNKLRMLPSFQVSYRTFTTKDEYSLMGEITEIAEWETKVVQSENLVRTLDTISIRLLHKPSESNSQSSYLLIPMQYIYTLLILHLKSHQSSQTE
jgi:hypothetical protein